MRGSAIGSLALPQPSVGVDYVDAHGRRVAYVVVVFHSERDREVAAGVVLRHHDVAGPGEFAPVAIQVEAALDGLLDMGDYAAALSSGSPCSLIPTRPSGSETPPMRMR